MTIAKPTNGSATRTPHRIQKREQRAESGSITVLVAACIVVIAALTLRVIELGVAAAERAKAQTAADAAALVGVVEGRHAADELATENGASLTAWADDGDEVEVEVTMGESRATARARRQATPPFG